MTLLSQLGNKDLDPVLKIHFYYGQYNGLREKKSLIIFYQLYIPFRHF